MATSLYKAQEALKTCAEHEHKELSFFCNTCKKFICISCGKTSHLNHEWDHIKSVAKERRNKTPMICRVIKKYKLSKYLGRLRSSDDVEKEWKEDLRKLEERRIVLISILNRIVDEKKKKRDDLARKQIKEIKKLEPKLSYLEKITTSLDSNIAAYSDYDVIEMEQQMLAVMGEVESYDDELAALGAAFVQGEVDEALLEKMIGKMEDGNKTDKDNTVSVEKMKTLTGFDEDGKNTNKDETVSVQEMKTITELHDLILSIAPISETEAWVAKVCGDGIELLSCQNMKANFMTLEGLYDFVILSNSDFIYITLTNRKIRRVTSTGEDTVLVPTKPLYPRNISKTWTDDVLITLVDGKDNFKLKPYSRRLVQRMTPTGEVLRTYEFREDGTTRLFTNPRKTVENFNSDVCVINETADTSELLVMHGDGRVRFSYPGQLDSEFIFAPTDVTCDSKSRIIVSDADNKCLYLLSPDGTFLRYLISDMFERLFALSLYQGCLWVGFGDGTVKVYKYTE